MRVQDFLKTPVPRPREITMVGAPLAALTGVYLAATPFIVPVCALYLSTYPFERVAAQTGKSVSELYYGRLAAMVGQLAAVAVVFVTAVACLRLRQWGRVAVEFILWTMLAWSLGFTGWTCSDLVKRPPVVASLVLCMFVFCVGMAWAALPALGIRLLHRPAVAVAIRAAEEARREERTPHDHPPTDPQHWPPTGDCGRHE